MKSPQRILIIRLDGLGDTLLTLPLLDGLKMLWRDCEITYFASSRGTPALADDPRIDRLWIGELAAMSRQEKWQWGRRIQSAGFDLVFCLNEKFWPAVWTKMSGASIRLGFDPGWTQLPKALLRRLTLTDFLFNPNDPGRRSIHEVERYAALAGLAIRQDPATHLSAAGPLRLFLPPLAEQAAKTWMAQHVPAGMLPVALHLSAKWAGEGWPDSTCIDLARSLLDRFPALFLLVTAGPGESRFWTGANTILPQGRVQLMEKLEFADWAALLSQCRALVTMDTGAVHLAAAVATPVVDVFPVMNFLHASSRWAPWQVSHRIVQRPSPEQATDFAAEIQAALEALL